MDKWKTSKVVDLLKGMCYLQVVSPGTQNSTDIIVLTSDKGDRLWVTGFNTSENINDCSHECDIEAVEVTDGVNPGTGGFVSDHKPELKDLYDETVDRLSNEFTVIGHRDDLSW